MDRTLRQRLEHLANELHLHRGQGHAAVDAAHADVDAALHETAPADGLRSRLELHAVELETEHPQLAGLLRGVIDSLSAAGL